MKKPAEAGRSKSPARPWSRARRAPPRLSRWRPAGPRARKRAPGA